MVETKCLLSDRLHIKFEDSYIFLLKTFLFYYKLLNTFWISQYIIIWIFSVAITKEYNLVFPPIPGSWNLTPLWCMAARTCCYGIFAWLYHTHHTPCISNLLDFPATLPSSWSLLLVLGWGDPLGSIFCFTLGFCVLIALIGVGAGHGNRWKWRGSGSDADGWSNLWLLPGGEFANIWSGVWTA